MVRKAWLMGLAVVVPLVAGQAQAAMTEAQVKQSLERAYNVTVLRITRLEYDGRAAFKVTFMNPGGNFNTAFQVNSVAVDAETGKLIVRFRHRSSGHDPNVAPRFLPDRQTSTALESGLVWR